MSDITNVFTDETVNKSSLSLVANEPHDLAISADINNSSGSIFNSARLSVTYSGLMPAGVLGSFYISTILEYKDGDGNWHPTEGYQFTPLRKDDQAPERVIILQPNIDTFSLGIDDIIYPADREISRTSRANGKLPEAILRVRSYVTDSDPTGVAGFGEVTINAELERYDV